jgi:hypothetical protein
MDKSLKGERERNEFMDRWIDRLTIIDSYENERDSFMLVDSLS